MSGKTWCPTCERFIAEADANGVRRCPTHGVLPGWSITRIIERLDNGPYLRADIDAVHNHGCPITRNGKRYGPCDCGAMDLLNRFLTEHGDDPWGAIRADRETAP